MSLSAAGTTYVPPRPGRRSPGDPSAPRSLGPFQVRHAGVFRVSGRHPADRKWKGPKARRFGLDHGRIADTAPRAMAEEAGLTRWPFATTRSDSASKPIGWV